ncbi:MAG: OsmC family protein, partial [Pseudomonadales bacterium]
MNQQATIPDVVRNGVNVTALGATIDAVSQEPTLAEFRFSSRNHWINGGHNRSRIQQFYGCGQMDSTRVEPFELDADEPPVLLGNDAGPNPVEFILHGLAGCMTTSMVYHAAARGIEIGAVESQFEGDLDL